jgi:hypothetical protein
MKNILITLLACLLVFDASDQLELKCPRGWSVQGQVVYSTSTTDQTHHTHQTNVAICFICRINSFEASRFGIVEMCVFDSSGFQKEMSYQKHKFCQYGNQQTETIEKLNISDVCVRRYSSTYCGVNVSKTTNISAALESIQFLHCDDAQVTQISPYSVDIQCPENWKVEEFKAYDKTYYFNYGFSLPTTKKEMCIICKPIKSGPNEVQINICSITLDFWSIEQFRDIWISKEENITVCEKTDLSHDDCAMSCGTRGRIEFSRYSTYFFKKYINCSEFDQNRFNSKGKIDDKSESDNYTEINFEKVKNSTSSVSMNLFLPSFGS